MVGTPLPRYALLFAMLALVAFEISYASISDTAKSDFAGGRKSVEMTGKRGVRVPGSDFRVNLIRTFSKIRSLIEDDSNKPNGQVSRDEHQQSEDLKAGDNSSRGSSEKVADSLVHVEGAEVVLLKQVHLKDNSRSLGSPHVRDDSGIQQGDVSMLELRYTPQETAQSGQNGTSTLQGVAQPRGHGETPEQQQKTEEVMERDSKSEQPSGLDVWQELKRTEAASDQIVKPTPCDRGQANCTLKTLSAVSITSVSRNDSLGKPQSNARPVDEEKPAMQRILKHLADASLKEIQSEFVRIGNASVPREKVTAVGDVDGNGFGDYVVANPAARNYSGTVRLYLMAENNGFLYTRDLIPGQRGFDRAALKPGDRYGSTVFRLPNSERDSHCFIAITAPGDIDTSQENGAIYVLQLSDRGNVINHAKTSTNRFVSLADEHNDDRDGGNLLAEKDSEAKNTARLSHLNGVTTMVFLKPSGEVKATLGITNHMDNMLLRHVDQYLSKRKIGMPKERMEGVVSRVVRPETCFFNETHCACDQQTPTGGVGQCLEVAVPGSHGEKTICQERACQPSYTCICDGQQLCKREDKTRSVYVADGRGSNGEIYCSMETRTFSENVVLDGALIPQPNDESQRSTFNETHCSCSPKSSASNKGTCLDYERTVDEIAIVCSPRTCKIPDNEFVCDGLGTSYCKRNFFQSRRYVYDGDIPSEPGKAYCHEEMFLAENATLITII